MLPRGLEPRTLRLLAVRSDQLSYKSARLELANILTKSAALQLQYSTPANLNREALPSKDAPPSEQEVIVGGACTLLHRL